MTEITQADRDAAAQYDVVEAFARHRIEERAAIVAWLRTQDDPNEKWSLQNSHWYAAEIEAGAHNK